MNEPLEQFQDWYHSRERAGLDSQSEYVKMRAAFYAGYRARPRPPIEPSRDALTYPPIQKQPMEEKRPLARATTFDYRELEHGARKYAQPGTMQPDYEWRPMSSSPVADLIQHGTITGRIPREARVPNFMPAEPLPQREGNSADTRDFPAVAGPSPETLERIHDQLLDRTKDVAATAESGLEHVETVYDGRYGARGPVRTAYELTEGENG